MIRRRLPNRRRSETTMLRWGKMNTEFAITVGYYPTGEPGELFISGAKAGSELDAIARDGAVLVSLGLQHGAPLVEIQGAVTRESNGAPSTIVGKAVDMMVGAENER
jgi:hypothetical protein